ncbi:MAG: hypothetical protein KF891_18815 [Rhizobacter sp.]|nr:hypothetical protein [Rhizobacter sp.]
MKGRIAMKRHPRVATLALAVAAAAIVMPAGATEQAPGPHGGQQMRVDGLDLELVATTRVLRLYVSGRGDPPDLARSRARITLVNGDDQQVVELSPAGDRLEAVGGFALEPGTEARATVAPFGHLPVTAHFLLQ